MSKCSPKVIQNVCLSRRKGEEILCVFQDRQQRKSNILFAFGTFACAVSSLWCHLTALFVLRTRLRGGAATFGQVALLLGQKNTPYISVRCIFLPQRLPTFPGSCPPSIIGTTELNYCVRYGYRCVLRVIITEFLNTTYLIFHLLYDKLSNSSWKSPRPISIGQLNTLLHLHLRPINHVVYMGSY